MGDSLLESEWIENDTLTVKVQLEVMVGSDVCTFPTKAKVTVPGATIHSNLLSFFDSGRCSDIVFVVEDQRIKAHSQILCARSEVFDRELNCGMRESTSREIEVNDCDAATFIALLRFL